MAAFRDATLFKTIYAFGLRRREAVMLDLADFSRNAKAAEFGRFGACHVRYGKAMRGSPPRRRTVLTVMAWSAEVLAEYVERCARSTTPGRRCGPPNAAAGSARDTSTTGSRSTATSSACHRSSTRTGCATPTSRT